MHRYQMNSNKGEIMMLIAELLQSAQFVVDAGGNKKAVVLDYSIWEELLTLLEDLEDIEEMNHLRKVGEETIPWNFLHHRPGAQRAPLDIFGRGIRIRDWCPYPVGPSALVRWR